MLSNGSEYLRIVIQWHLNSFFSKKFQKIAQRLGVSPPVPKASGGYGPRPQSVIRLSYTSFPNTFPKLDTCAFQLLALSPLPLQNPG